MKFLATNLCTEGATTIVASSANANFPVANLKNPLRSKRWRSSGYFLVDSSNNKINFKESSGGSELTATLTNGTYSPSGLAAEIENKMDAAGTDSFSVTFSRASGLWTIESDGSELEILNDTGTDSSSSLLVNSLGFASSDLTGDVSYTGDVIAIHTQETVLFDMKTSQNIDSVVILWPKEDGIRLSPSAEIRVQASATNLWTSPAVDEVLTVDNHYLVASHFFSSPQSYRYWRLVVTDPSNPDLFVELGMVWIGENIRFREPENGFKFSLADTSKVSSTDFGHEYVDEYPLMSSLQFNYSYIGYETAQALEDAYRSNGVRKPVLVVFDESELVFTKNHFLIYGKFPKQFGTDHVNFDIFNGSLTITELG